MPDRVAQVCRQNATAAFFQQPARQRNYRVRQLPGPIIINLSLTPGTRLGVYQVTAPIGEGGMGQVFRATDTKLKRHVAIKILPPSLAADHDRLARFQREAKSSPR